MNLGSSIQQLRQEWKQNPRLRLGVMVVGVLLAFYGISGLSGIRQRLADDYQLKLAELGRIQALSKDDGWDRRALSARTLRDSLEAEVPTADSVGLAQATFQGLLRNVADGFGPRLSLNMGQPVKVEGMPGYWQFPAQLSGPLPVRDALQLVRQIEKQKDLVTIQAMQLSTGGSASINLTVSAFYRISKPRGQDASP